MIESIDNEGVVAMSEALLKSFIKDVRNAFKFAEPYRTEKLSYYKREAEQGILSYVLDVAGTDFDGIVAMAQKLLEDKNNGNKRTTQPDPTTKD